MIKAIVLSLSFILAAPSFAQCNFKTGEWIEELQSPKYLKSIEVRVNKSKKFTQNFLKIMTTSDENIRPELRKRFKASVIAKYSFGSCVFSAKVRQHGDFKDHIQLRPGGKPLRSLDVKLQKGNLLGSVRFKLLIPETRDGIHEILATLILKKVGFIAPETFETDTVVNGVKAKMLFQETARKELLEKNLRRESAIFEGDERLLWSYGKYNNFELESLALSRMVNDNWFVKGKSSEKISLVAYAKLQSSYLEYATSLSGIGGNLFIIFPNRNENNTFANYFFTLLAMKGFHALRPHNRQYYFNAISAKFEPIYFDGNVNFAVLSNLLMGRELSDILPRAFTQAIDDNFIRRLQKVTKTDELKVDFLQRVKAPRADALSFLSSSLAIFSNNIKQLEELIRATDFTSSTVKSKDTHIKNYMEFQKNKGVEQRIITEVKIIKNDYLVTFSSEEVAVLSVEDMAEVISNNTYKDERVVLLDLANVEFQISPRTMSLKNFPGEISAASGIKIELNVDKNLIAFTQSNANDWVLINSANLNGWKVKFNGAKDTTNHASNSQQRFNQFGLTGCLTVYNSTLDNTDIEVDGGICEDSLNIVESTGHLNSVSVNHAFADAVDIDFSTIKIGKLQVSGAGNDCFDVSGGDYMIENAKLTSCGDKGVSVGEASTFKATTLKLANVNIGISSKDLSKVEIKKASMEQASVCAEVMQKKQEFGGAYLLFNELNCDGINNIDINSVFIIGNP